MMQPKTVSLYVPEIDKVAQDFIDLTKRNLDKENETPKNYGAFIQQYTMEAIGTIAFDTRLNVLEPKEGTRGTELTKLVNEMLQLTYELDFLPSIWKYVWTPKYNRFMKVMNKSAE